MSSIPVTEITNQECEKGQLTQRPPIPYATSKAKTILKASRETVKMKTMEGEVKMAVLGSRGQPRRGRVSSASQCFPANVREEEMG